MATDNLDIIAAFIADIEAKIASLRAVLVSLQSASALGALGTGLDVSLSSSTPSGFNGDMGQPLDLPEGAFYGKSVPACIELYLSSVKKKKTNKEIADALHKGGVESNASKLDNTVNGALFKLKQDGKVLRFKNGWGLSSWYPAHIRAVTPAPSAKRGKKKSKKNERKAAPAKPPASLTQANQSGPKGKASDLILEVLRADPKLEFTLEEIAAGAKLGVKFTRLSLGKLVKAGHVLMSSPGFYAIAKLQLAASNE